MEVPAAPPIPDSADPLTEALSHLRMEGIFYCRSELTAPWSLRLPPMPDCVWFHVVTAGSCLLLDSSGAPRVMDAGDLLVLPRGAGHGVSDSGRPEREADGLLDVEPSNVLDLPHDYVSPNYAVLRHGGGGAQVDLTCGAVRLGHPAARHLIEVLPEVIHVEAASDPTGGHLPAVLAMIAAEAADPRMGGEAVITRLCDILVISAIRSWVDTDSAGASGWVGALQDPQIGAAVAHIHREPERPWTVAELAATAAMSRSGFSARFRELVGEGPMHYVARWRMLIATDLLQTERLTVAAVGERLGYASEAAFSRAYKRTTGLAPGAVRRRTPVDLVAS